MPHIIYNKKAMKSIRSLDIRVKDRVKAGIEKIPFGDIKKFEEEAAMPDEIEAIREARREIENGDLFSHEEVWA